MACGGAMMNLGRFSELRHHFAMRGGRPCVLGVSGGRTSGVMDALSDPGALRSFQNTGEEHRRTYEFLDELAEATGHDIVWLEYRAPRRRGAPPREATFAIVNSKTADRGGGPFDEMLEALAAYRATKGLGPVAPWARSRICTAYLKSRTQDRWLESLGIDVRDEFSGLRTDEPTRVRKFELSSTWAVQKFAPLSRAGITVDDVAEFWSMQSFDLGIDPLDGNCNNCFLKDEADQARTMLRSSHETRHRWIERQRLYNSFGGRKHPGYERLLDEAPGRLEIEAALRAGQQPKNTHNLDARRFKLVVIQERKRIKGEVAPFSCGCEGAETLAGMSEEEEEQFVLSLPST